MFNDELTEYEIDILYDRNIVRTVREFCEDEEEAKAVGEDLIDDKIEQWMLDGAWNEDDDRKYFDVVVNEV